MLLKCHMWWQSLRPSERVVLGVVINGKAWGRPNDRNRHAYLAAGGLGILIGDGRYRSAGFLYLAVVLDAFSRRIVGRSMSSARTHSWITTVGITLKSHSVTGPVPNRAPPRGARTDGSPNGNRCDAVRSEVGLGCVKTRGNEG
jgi:hypothetical protein